MFRNSIEVRLQKPHAAQQQLIDEARRFNVACMGRRFGKTALGIRVVADQAVSRQPTGWFAPTYKLLDEAWREARRRLAPIITRQDSQQHRLELITGGTIDFWTLDNPDAGRGRKYALVVVDEAAMARNLEEAWTQAIRPTLADLSGSAWFLSTPKGGNYFKTLYDRAGDEEEWQRWQMPTRTNPYIQPEEIDAMRHDLPEIVFRQEVLAEFVDLAGAVVQREWLRHSGPPAGLTVVFGVDLAISTRTEADYTAIVAMARDTQGTVYLLDVQRIQAPFHGVLSFIQQMAAQWKPAVIAIEQVQYQVAVVQELLRTTTLPVTGVRPDKDKLTRFLPLLARYEQRLVCHAPGLPHWFEEELLTFPMGEHDDGCLVAGTQIKTAMGMKRIEEVNVGDQVMTRRGVRRVLAAGITSRNAMVFTVSFSNGASLTGTGNHPIMTTNGWIELQKLSEPLVIGNLPESNDKNIAPVYVLSVIPEALPTAVFNLTVEGEPEYYANGVLVHNCDAASLAFQALPADTIPDYSMGGLSRRFEGAL